MKKILSIILLVCSLGVITACNGNGGEQNPEDSGDEATKNAFVMTATLKAVGDKLEVDVTEGEYGASGPYLIIASDATEITDRNGKKISKDSLKVGQTLEITYSGQVMMSYPPQVAAIKIKVK